ncbi:MAG: hypothetical protein KDA84_20205, partial [Planctomycetaceae bacterium]|nr:hypothetical protein [Planctomycetaceae bacterium]
NPAAITEEPSPEEATELEEVLEAALTNLKLPIHREMVELRLEGLDVPEIAAKIGRAERSVRRVMKQFHDDLENRLRAFDAK